MLTNPESATLAESGFLAILSLTIRTDQIYLPFAKLNVNLRQGNSTPTDHNTNDQYKHLPESGKAAC
jgi:hypothetical protein